MTRRCLETSSTDRARARGAARLVARLWRLVAIVASVLASLGLASGAVASLALASGGLGVTAAQLARGDEPPTIAQSLERAGASATDETPSEPSDARDDGEDDDLEDDDAPAPTSLGATSLRSRSELLWCGAIRTRREGGIVDDERAGHARVIERPPHA